MSKQLYNYIATLIVDYFTNQSISSGDRFNFYLENQQHVKGLYQQLKETELSFEEFNYTHPEGDGSEYKTFTLNIKGTKLIIASSENASEDYFTMLRNQVAEQKGVFADTAILILFSGKLDSLLGGSGSLIKEGMPLHYKSFKDTLKEGIDNSETFKDYEKITLKEVLEQKTNSVVEDNNSIFDYEQIITSLVNQKIKPEDYKDLGLFKNEELASISESKNIKKALKNNFELFGRLENMHLHGNPEVELEKLVSETGKQNLAKENWNTYDYSEIIKWKRDKEKRVAPIFQEVIGTDVFKTIWWKADGDTVSAKRSNSIIIFNPNNEFPINLELKFDQPTKTEGILIKKGKENLSVSSSGHSLKIKIAALDANEPFSVIHYKDNYSNKLYKFKILLLSISETFLKNFETDFFISNKINPVVLINDTSDLLFNPGIGNTIEETLVLNKTYEIDPSVEFKIYVDYALVNEDLTPFKININKVTIPFAIKTESEPPKPIIGLDVWKDKRQFETNFSHTYEEDVFKLKFRNNERTVRNEFRKNLLLEKQIIESNLFSWTEKSDHLLEGRDLDISDVLKKSFNELRNYFKENKALPSLVFLKEGVKKLAITYVEAYLSEFKLLKENEPITVQQKDLVWLGVVKEQFNEGLIKYTPLHPINVAYQLLLNDQLGNEDVYGAILKRLNSANLVPFIEDNKKVYMPVDSEDSPEWTYYTEYLQSEKSVPKSFITKLITSKLEGFTHNFDFLFSQSNFSPIIINVINLGDCTEVVQGVFEYYRLYLNKNTTKRPSNLLPININIYGSENLVTKFEELTYYDIVEEVENKIQIKLKTNNFEKEDLLNSFLEKVNFYRKPFPKKDEEYEYAHITFYQFDREQIKRNTNKTDKVKSGLSMNGLMSDVSSTPINQTYRTGFGTANMPEEKSIITDLVCNYNALVNVASNGENFELNKAICCTIDFNIKSQLEKLYKNSQWVTYIDPKVDLDFFKEKEDLVIIHYSDQYNNSSGYDAITVSSKTDQYANIVGEFLTKNQVQYQHKKDTLSVINFFNAINGDWLLKLIRQSSQFPREKISLLSGIKTALTFLNHPNIIWIPVSLEEILRISGSAGLKKSDGLFSATNLGSKEFSFSDDLLMIGLENCDNSLKMHLYPVELKIGSSNLITKGIDQGKRTATLLQKHLQSDGFLGKFYKNFFGKLAITNAEKMNLYNIWGNQQWETVYNSYRSDLMNNNFEFSTKLNNLIGEFGLIHFGKGTIHRELKVEQGYLIAKLLEEDGYNFLVKSIDELIELFHHKQTGIEKANLLSYKLPNGTCNENCLAVEKEKTETNELFIKAPAIEKTEKTDVTKEHQVPLNKGIEVLFGTNLKNGEKVLWEPNNTDKVMHTNTGIIGTMGTGKTQFTKSLIAQLVTNQDKNIGPDKLGVLIFDYKGDYIKDDFVNATSAKVYDPFHLPYNPLALDATEQSKPMLPLHTANDIKETISNAFNLGNVQKQKLRNAIIEAYEAKGIYKAKRNSWTLPPPTIGDVCDIYMQDEKVAQDSLYAAISNLQDFEIFEPDVSKTKSLYDLVEGVTVINLSGYDESIQNLIVAITLDAFYTQMQTHGHSIIEDGKRQIKKMILVDEADNFLSKNFNSIKKILKEGREFGVGTVLSTQFLNHFSTSENDYSNYILTWVIHRVSEIKTKEVESLFSIESKDQRDNLIKTIKGLEKHQSIVNLAGSPPILIKDKAFWELTTK
ncbi:DNA phosphorothioation-dependent restriction protein DptH [Formosa algae]|nr:DNA phosphorothioation-dependent restriction protein DptH [Formosa algae]